MKKTLLILTTLFLFSCCDLFQRFDPLEESKNILTIEELIFYAYMNPSLSMVSKATINQEDMSIDITMPPSLDLSANNLIAQCLIKESAKNGGDEYQILMNRLWEQNDRITVDRKDFDPLWEGESSFVNEYKLNVKREFVSKLTTPSDNYSNIPNFTIKIYFNDIADPDILSSSNFKDGFQIIGDIIPITVGDFSNPSFTGDNLDDSSSYDLNITANSQGKHKITLLADSIASTPSSVQNTTSNSISVTYDNSVPVLPTVNVVTASDLDLLTITDYHDATLSLEFEEATDNLTSGTELLYNFYFSDNPADVTGLISNVLANGYELLYQGQKNIPYQTKFNWSFATMPQDLKDRLIQYDTLFFNVIVKDKATNLNIYTNGTQTYYGPDYP